MQAKGLIAQRLFWWGAALCATLVATTVVIHAHSAAQSQPQVVWTVEFSSPALSRDTNRHDNEGTLTLQEYYCFEFHQHLDWQSQFGISADALLATGAEDVTPAVPRRWRSREPRISLMGDTTSGSAIRFEN